MIYVMSDIHGHCKLFQKMLRKIRFKQSDCLYILGDIFDKGKENLRLYRFVKSADNIILIKGNHEYLCERYLSGQIDGDFWDACGGVAARAEVDALSEKERMELHWYLKALPIYQEVTVNSRLFFLTHSGYHAEFCVKVPGEDLVDIEQSVKAAVEWNQEGYLFSNDIHYIPASIRFDKRVIVGHVPTQCLGDFQIGKIVRGQRYIDVDTGCGINQKGGKLSCLCLDDGSEYYVNVE